MHTLTAFNRNTLLSGAVVFKKTKRKKRKDMEVKELQKYIEDKNISPRLSVDNLFLKLLIDKAVNFQSISEAYVRYLEVVNGINKNVIVEATTNIFQMMDPAMRDDRYAINRALYTLDTYGNINISGLKDKYGYDKEEAEKFINEYYGTKG